VNLIFSYISFGQNSNGEHVLVERVKTAVAPQSERFQNYLANALVVFARDAASCASLLDLLQKVETGEQERGEWSVDDVELQIAGTSVQVNINVNDDWIDNPAGRFHIEQWRTALKAQQMFLGLPRHGETTLEADIPDELTEQSVK
jgi:hypothetical protein